MHCNATHTRHNSHTARAATAGSALTATPEGTQPHTELGTDREDEHFRHSNLHSVQPDVTHVPGLRPLCRCITTPQYHSSGFGSQGGGRAGSPNTPGQGGGVRWPPLGRSTGSLGGAEGLLDSAGGGDDVASSQTNAWRQRPSKKIGSHSYCVVLFCFFTASRFSLLLWQRATEMQKNLIGRQIWH